MSRDGPILQGRVDATGLKIGVVAARFNEEITDKLLAGALRALQAHGASETNIHVVRVPGAFEIGAVAALMANSGYQAIVCLGCVIRGQSTHYDHVCQGVTAGVAAVANRGDVGVGFGVLTVENADQARDRAGGRYGNKGEEAALTAVEMARLLQAMVVQ